MSMTGSRGEEEGNKYDARGVEDLFSSITREEGKGSPSRRLISHKSTMRVSSEMNIAVEQEL